MAKNTSQKEVTFFAKYGSLRIVVRPIRVSVVDGVRIVTPGKTAEFQRGEYRTSDAEMIEYLREHGTYGQDYFESEADMAATTNQEERGVTSEDRPEVAKPTRTKAGERAAVKAKPTTAADLDAEEGATASADESDE